jgi:hypothetical protein
MSNKQIHLTDEQIQSYLDQEQDRKELEILQKHLDICSSCQEMVDKQINLVTRLEELPGITLGNDLTANILDQIKIQKQLRKGVTWIIAVEALAAVAVVSVLIPALDFSAWTPTFINTRQDFLVSINIFLTQLASTWIYWWSQLQMDFQGLLDPIRSQANLTIQIPEPWILILAAGCIGVLVNYLLLREKPIKNHNHQT